jgi:hypothetical protein
MLRRCTDPKYPKFRIYGKRGIRVARSWYSFKRFIEDMGPRPSPKHSIGRIDNNKNYSKNNCTWQNKFEQAHNKNNNHFVTINGVRKILILWIKKFKLKQSTVYSRLDRGWTDLEALGVVFRKKKVNQYR